MHPIAQSTVALNAYNLVCLARGPIHRDVLFERVNTVGMGAPDGKHQVEREWFDAAIKKALELSRLNETDAGIDVGDPQRRIVRNRDTSDFAYGSDGMATGGWNGWLAQCPRCGAVTIEEAIGGKR